jgi:hypothetical protein
VERNDIVAQKANLHGVEGKDKNYIWMYVGFISCIRLVTGGKKIR